MIRTLLATTALAAFLASGAMAQEAVDRSVPAKSAMPATQRGPAGYFSAAPEQILASSVLGKTVYTGSDEQGEAIGDVNDVVINADGGAEALVIGVGGFLGLGEKDVAVGFDRISWSDRDGERIIVVSATREELQAAPEFARAAMMNETAATLPEDESAEAQKSTPPIPSEETAQSTQPLQQTTGTTPQMTDPDAALPLDTHATASTDSDMKLVDPAGIASDKLIGTDVKVADDTKVGEIGDVIRGQDGTLEAYIIDVGGFLGLGQKPVAISAESVQVMTDADGNFTIYSPFTRQQLENQVAYDETAYKANPEGVLLRAPAN